MGAHWASLFVGFFGATLGVFVLRIFKGKFGVPAVLGMMAVVSLLGLAVTLIFGHEGCGRLNLNEEHRKDRMIAI